MLIEEKFILYKVTFNPNGPLMQGGIQHYDSYADVEKHIRNDTLKAGDAWIILEDTQGLHNHTFRECKKINT